MDITTGITEIVKTGKVEIGTRKMTKLALTQKPKIIIMSSNCPARTVQDINNYTKDGEIRTIVFPGTSLQLGEVCGKPFSVSVLCVLDLGRVSLSEICNKGLK